MKQNVTQFGKGRKKCMNKQQEMDRNKIEKYPKK